jgi:hypothetical protein
VDSLTHSTAWLAGLFVAAVAAVVLYVRRRKQADVSQSGAAEAAPVSERAAEVDPMIALLKSRLFDFENGSGDDEKDEAIGIILTSGHRYGLASVFELDYDDGIVRVHDLQRSGRRVYIRIRDISAIEGSEDE